MEENITTGTRNEDLCNMQESIEVHSDSGHESSGGSSNGGMNNDGNRDSIRNKTIETFKSGA